MKRSEKERKTWTGKEKKETSRVQNSFEVLSCLCDSSTFWTHLKVFTQVKSLFLFSLFFFFFLFSSEIRNSFEGFKTNSIQLKNSSFEEFNDTFFYWFVGDTRMKRNWGRKKEKEVFISSDTQVIQHLYSMKRRVKWREEKLLFNLERERKNRKKGERKRKEKISLTKLVSLENQVHLLQKERN